MQLWGLAGQSWNPYCRQSGKVGWTLGQILQGRSSYDLSTDQTTWLPRLNSLKDYSFSCVWLFVTPWTVAHQAPLSMELSRQEYWSVYPFPSPGDLPNTEIEPGSPALQADSTVWATREAHAWSLLLSSFPSSSPSSSSLLVCTWEKEVSLVGVHFFRCKCGWTCFAY